MSKLSTTKGKVFERRIAAQLRTLWPDAVVRRASQADRAHQSDVCVTGGPPILARLWLELQDSRNPTPLAKLEQAEQDVLSGACFERLPVVIWHRTNERTTHATMRLWVMDVLRGVYRSGSSEDLTVVTIDAQDLWAIVKKASQAGTAAA